MAQPSRKYRYLDPATLQKLESLDLVAREVVEGIRVGMHKSPLRGFSTEFTQHRQYVAGDTLRHVDWRVYGRTERYYVKLFEAETNFNATLLIDASSSMHYRSGPVSKLEYAKFMAASLAHLIVRQRDSAGLGVFDAALRTFIEPKCSQAIVRTIAEELAKVDPQPKTDIAEMLHEFARRLPRRGFVILFSDLFDDVDGFLKGFDHLRFRGHNVTVFHTMDPYELEFPFNGTWKFKDLELTGELVTQPRRVQAAYLEEVRKFIKHVKEACERNHVDYVLVNTSRPVDAVLSGYLISRLRTVTKHV